MVYIAIGNVRHNGKGYKKGDSVPGLKEAEVERLLELKVIESIETPGDSPIDDGLLTSEDFGKLSAADQKEQLDSCGMEPASNADARIQQYTEWYAGQVNSGDGTQL